MCFLYSVLCSMPSDTRRVKIERGMEEEKGAVLGGPKAAVVCELKRGI